MAYNRVDINAVVFVVNSSIGIRDVGISFVYGSVGIIGVGICCS